MQKPKRSSVMFVRVSESERVMVEHLAQLDGLSLSDAIRQAVRAVHRQRVKAQAAEDAGQKGAAA